jgi:hypothetical protein
MPAGAGRRVSGARLGGPGDDLQVGVGGPGEGVPVEVQVSDDGVAQVLGPGVPGRDVVCGPPLPEPGAWAVTLQFIGRFARTSAKGNFGGASMFVARTEIEVDKRLRELYAEDSDWNLVLRDLTHAAVEQQQEASDFENAFTSLPEEVTIGLNVQAGVAWCIVKRNAPVRWGDLKTIEDVTFELYILDFDATRHLLYINNSANSGLFEELAEAVAGPGATRFTGSTVYRVMADIDRLVPTTVGVIDARDQFRRFSMHVGSDVTASFSQAEAGTKSQTNISGGGYRDGEHVSCRVRARDTLDTLCSGDA